MIAFIASSLDFLTSRKIKHKIEEIASEIRRERQVSSKIQLTRLFQEMAIIARDFQEFMPGESGGPRPQTSRT